MILSASDRVALGDVASVGGQKEPQFIVNMGTGLGETSGSDAQEFPTRPRWPHKKMQ